MNWIWFVLGSKLRYEHEKGISILLYKRDSEGKRTRILGKWKPKESRVKTGIRIAKKIINYCYTSKVKGE